MSFYLVIIFYYFSNLNILRKPFENYSFPTKLRFCGIEKSFKKIYFFRKSKKIEILKIYLLVKL
jgi:hypothetical protein